MNNKISFYMRPYPYIKSYYQMIDAAVEHGLSSVEGFCMFEFENPDVESAKKIKEYADSKNVVFPCFSLFINLVGDDAAEKIERAKGYADVAAALGSPYLHHTIVCDFSNPDKIVPRKDEFFEKGIDAVRQIYDYAESIGVKTIYEEQGFVFNGVDGIGKLLSVVDRNVGVVADFGNIYQSPDDLLDFIKAYGDKVCHAHIKDITLTDDNNDGCGIKTITGKYMREAKVGTGIVKIQEAIELLKSFGYDGYYGVEAGASEDDSPVVRETLNLIDSML